MMGHNQKAEATAQPPRARRSAVVASLLLLATSLAGGAVLVWWALEFHRANDQLWMVPVGLVLFSTPIVVWFSVFASDACQFLQPEASV
ncbi:hypothetical protein QJS04_geneDACA010801 [Acorus gramineus]|uniref:Transmembrane protein n=1 Tax=Acorus gramineus TaxID=55184 RepID=A0AAV9BBE2_ACOGR|nr:hypothetical protein QJS04_geneDACA010801 [Acorus gramineus]